MGSGDLDLVRGAWAAFAAGDVEGVAAVLHPEVRWYAAEEPDAGGTCHNRAEAVAFIQRSLADGVSAELLELREIGDRVLSTVQTHVPPEWGEPPPPHAELVTVRDGKIVEIIAYPTIDDAVDDTRQAG